jgi:hypothetical protein
MEKNNKIEPQSVDATEAEEKNAKVELDKVRKQIRTSVRAGGWKIAAS